MQKIERKAFGSFGVFCVSALAVAYEAEARKKKNRTTAAVASSGACFSARPTQLASFLNQTLKNL